MHVTVRPLSAPAAAVLGWLLGFAAPVLAQNDAIRTTEGLFVTVPNPITSDAVQRIRNQVEARQGNAARPLQTLVIDFNPDGKDVATADFGPCYSLAEFVGRLKASVTTVAFVHGKLSGHTVLPVLACKELVMSRGGRIGEVVSDTEPPPDKTKQAAYLDYAADRRQKLAAVQKMYDKGVQLGVARNLQGQLWYIDRRNEAAEKKEHQLGAVQPVDFAPDDRVALYTADQARQLDLCNAIAESRTDVAELYSLPPSAVRDDILKGRAPDAYRLTLTGEVDGAMRESLARTVRELKRKKANVLLLTLNCGGGDLGVARSIADDLREAQTGDDALMVVAYVPERAPDSATFLAFGATDLVMSRRRDAVDPDRPNETPEATLGDFSAAMKGGKPGTLDAHRKSLRELAELRSVPAVLVDGMFDRDLEIVRVKATKGPVRRLMTQAEYEADKANWTFVKNIKPKGQLLNLTATLAEELGVARYTVENRDPAGVYALYGLDSARVKEVAPGWLDRFADFLKMPVVTVMLVVIGFTGLILELKVPGLTFPGIIAALCFILVFWSQSRFSGEMFVLALLLFLLGLVLVAIEIFILPGFGAPGIFGILCMLGGLGLVTFERVPQTGEEWVGLGVKVSQYMFGMIGAFVLAFVIARFLPRVPYANRLLLAPPADAPGAGESALPGAGEAAELLGAIGTANTPLRPAGVVRFADKFVDVVSDGGFIPAGNRVQVVAVEGTRIVVKEV